MMDIQAKLRAVAKSLSFKALSNPVRIHHRLKTLTKRDIVTILNLHRVAPDDGSTYRPLDPNIFKQLLLFVKRNYDVRTFSNIDEPSDRPRIILSFDDGYLDFFNYAAPLLEEHDLRVNHNVIPNCIESGLPPLNVMVQDFIGKAPRELVENLDVPGFGKNISPELSNSLSHFIKFQKQADQDALSEYLMPQLSRFSGFRPVEMMNVDQIKQVGTRHELGAHSYSHSSMEHESDEFLRNDVLKCQEYFRSRLKRNVDIYAFPNGSCRLGQDRIVLEAGISRVLLVGEKFDKGGPVHYRFTFDANSRSEMLYKATGRMSLLA